MSCLVLNFKVNADLIDAHSVFCLEFDPDSGCLHIQFFQGIETVLQENMNELK